MNVCSCSLIVIILWQTSFASQFILPNSPLFFSDFSTWKKNIHFTLNKIPWGSYVLIYSSSRRKKRQTTRDQLTTLPPSKKFSVLQNVAEIEPHQPVPKADELSHAAAVVLRLRSTSAIKVLMVEDGGVLMRILKRAEKKVVKMNKHTIHC